MKYLLALFMFISLAASGQYDSTKIFQAQNSYGFEWKNMRVNSSWRPPRDTPHMAMSDTGAIAVKGSIMYVWNLNRTVNRYRWDTLSGGGGGTGITNLGATQNAVNYLITSSTGTPATLLPATPLLAGLQDTTGKNLLDSIRTGTYWLVHYLSLKTGKGLYAGGVNGDSIYIKNDSTDFVQDVRLNAGFIQAFIAGAWVNKVDMSGFGGLPDPGSNGIVARTALNTTAARTLTGTSNRISITNGSGASGNPTFDIGSDVVTLTGTQTLTNKALGMFNTTWTGFTLSKPAIQYINTDGTISYIDGNSGQVVTWSGGAPIFANLSVNASTDISAGTLSIARGGTSFGTYTTGDMLYASATNTLSKLAAGTNGYVLTMVSGVPAWAVAGGGGSTLVSKAIGFGNSSNALTGDSSKIKFNSANSSLFINLNNTRPVADGTKVIHWFGDSITAGFITTTTDQRTSSLVTKALGYTEDNQGYSGGTLMKRVPVDPFGTANMVDRISSIPVHSSGDKYIIFWLGTNDIRVPSTYWNTTYSVANFVADYSTILDSTIIARGHPADSVVILSPAHLVPESFLVADSAAGRLRQLSIDSACQVVATIKGCRYFNTDSLMKTVGSDAINLLNPDFVHPNQGGHAMLAAGIAHFLSSIGMDSQEPQQLAVGGLSEFQNVRYRNPRFIPRWSRPLGVDSSGNIGITRHIYLPGNIYARGSTVSDGPENGIFPTGIRSGGLRLTDVPPSVSTGTMLELFYDPVNSYASVNAYNKAGGAGIPLVINGNGGKVTIGSFYGGFTDKTNFSGSAGFNDGLIIRGSNPAAGPGLSMSYFGSFCTVDALSGILGLNGNGGGLVTVGAYADNGTGAKFQVSGASSFRLSGGSGSTIDYPITVSALSGFSPIAGYGVGEKFEAHNASSVLKVVGTTDFAYTTTTASSESADWILKTIRAGTLTEGFRIKSTGIVNAPAYTGTGVKVAGFDASGNMVRTSIDTGGGSTLTLAAVGSSPNANAATYSGGTLNLQPASGSFPGVVTTGSQTLAGVKTFSSTPVVGTASAHDSSASAASTAYCDKAVGAFAASLEKATNKTITTSNTTPVIVDTLFDASIAGGNFVKLTVEVTCNAVRLNADGGYAAKKIRTFYYNGSTLVAKSNHDIIADEYDTGLSSATFSIIASGGYVFIQWVGEGVPIQATFSYQKPAPQTNYAP
jgi:hypothetical protein